MVQVQERLHRVEKLPYQRATRATPSQKCVRAGASARPDNVCYTARHLTFSRGRKFLVRCDYFKERAIELAGR